MEKAELLYISPLRLISNSIRYSHATWNSSDTEKEKKKQIAKAILKGNYINNITGNYILGQKDYDLIKRVGFHQNHSSVLEHSLIVYDVLMSTKALLEESRHRIGVSQTVTSTRYAIDKVDVIFTKSLDNKVNTFLEKQRKDIIKLFNEYRDENNRIKQTDMDNLALVLPQAFMYKLQLSFNLRSLEHFLELRLSKSAHFTIRRIAKSLFNVLPCEWQNLLLENKNIKRSIK